MKRPRLRHALVAPCLATATLAHAADARFAWPHGEKAAVSLAYDDAIDSHLDNAIPALRRTRNCWPPSPRIAMFTGPTPSSAS